MLLYKLLIAEITFILGDCVAGRHVWADKQPPSPVIPPRLSQYRNYSRWQCGEIPLLPNHVQRTCGNVWTPCKIYITLPFQGGTFYVRKGSYYHSDTSLPTTAIVKELANQKKVLWCQNNLFRLRLFWPVHPNWEDGSFFWPNNVNYWALNKTQVNTSALL